jgi:small-conductance mechanosensitive channel
VSPFLAELRRIGIEVPREIDPVELGAAGALVVLFLALGWWAGRQLNEPAKRLWQRFFGQHAGGFGSRVGEVIRHGVAALGLAIAFRAHPWTPAPRLLIGFVLAAAAARLTIAVLRGLGIAQWIARATAVLVFALLLARALGGFDEFVSLLRDIGFDVGSRRISLLSVFTVAATLVALYAAVRVANRLLAHTIDRTSGFDPTQKLLAQKLAGMAVVIAAFFVGIDLLGIDLTAFAVFSGAFGLAIGFGFQKTFGNLLSGIILLMDRSIKPGDVIVVGDSFGWVNKIGIRAVSVITRDGKEHLIPNENLMTQEVENWSYSDRNVRVRIPVGVAYDCDLKLAQELMLRATLESPRVLNEPKPNVWLLAFGDNAVEHEILAWISDPEGGVGNVRSDVLNRLWWLFKEHGIGIPYPQRDVYIRSLPDGGGRVAEVPQSAK